MRRRLRRSCNNHKAATDGRPTVVRLSVPCPCTHVIVVGTMRESTSQNHISERNQTTCGESQTTKSNDCQLSCLCDVFEYRWSDRYGVDVAWQSSASRQSLHLAHNDLVRLRRRRRVGDQLPSWKPVGAASPRQTASSFRRGAGRRYRALNTRFRASRNSFPTPSRMRLLAVLKSSMT